MTIEPIVLRSLLAFVGVAIVVAVTQLLSRTVGRRVDDATMRHRLRRILRATAWAVALVVIASTLGGELGRVGVILGVAGAGVAFALQEVIVSFAGWVAIALGGFYRVGDRVRLGGIRGDVISISLLRTTLLEVGDWVDGDLYNGRIVRIANSFVFREPVFNYSLDFPFVWDELRVPITHDSDRQAARRLLASAAAQVAGTYADEVLEAWQAFERKFPVERGSLEPTVTVTITDNWLAYTVRYVADYRARRAMHDQLAEAVMQGIDASEDTVRLASATFAVVGAPTLRVDLRGDQDAGTP